MLVRVQPERTTWPEARASPLKEPPPGNIFTKEGARGVPTRLKGRLCRTLEVRPDSKGPFFSLELEDPMSPVL